MKILVMPTIGSLKIQEFFEIHQLARVGFFYFRIFFGPSSSAFSVGLAFPLWRPKRAAKVKIG